MVLGGQNGKAGQLYGNGKGRQWFIVPCLSSIWLFVSCSDSSIEEHIRFLCSEESFVFICVWLSQVTADLHSGNDQAFGHP